MQYKIARFDIADILPIALTFVVAGIGIAFGLNIMGDSMKDFGADSCSARSDTFTTYNATNGACQNSSGSFAAVSSGSFNATQDSMVGVAKIPEKMPLLVNVVVAAIIIGMLVRYLMVRYD